MKCPKCQNEMKITRSDESSNTETSKKYLRVIYHCEVDDIWLNLETPKINKN